MLYFLLALVALSPTYILRFQVGPFPLNLLEILAALFLVSFGLWLRAKGRVNEFLQYCKNHSRFFLISAGLFFLAGIISFFVSPVKQRALGLFIVLFLEPMLLYFPAGYLLKEERVKNLLTKTIIFVSAIFGAYAIFQYHTSVGLPVAWYGNPVEPRRALSVFAHPNEYGLWLAPLLAFTLPFLFKKDWKNIWPWRILWAVSFVGLLYSESRGALLGFAAAALAYLLLSKNKKAWAGVAIIFIILGSLIFTVPALKTRLSTPFKGDRATNARFQYWKVGRAMIKDSPITGKGLYGYKTFYDRYNTDPTFESLPFPHNIFLNFWVETGVLGVISFTLISLWGFKKGWRSKNTAAGMGLLLFLIALWVHGSADAPYLKNDLALIFWVILSAV